MLEGCADLALEITKNFPQLAFALNENKETGLHVLARKPSAFKSQGRTYVNRFMSPCKFYRTCVIVQACFHDYYNIIFNK